MENGILHPLFDLHCFRFTKQSAHRTSLCTSGASLGATSLCLTLGRGQLRVGQNKGKAQSGTVPGMDHHSTLAQISQTCYNRKRSITAKVGHMTAEFADGNGNVVGKVTEHNGAIALRLQGTAQIHACLNALFVDLVMGVGIGRAVLRLLNTCQFLRRPCRSQGRRRSCRVRFRALRRKGSLRGNAFRKSLFKHQLFFQAFHFPRRNAPPAALF